MSHAAIDSILPALNRRLEAHSETASLDAQVLIAHVIDRPRTWVLAHPEHELDHSQIQDLQSLAARFEDGEPLPYILGRWEFFGFQFDLSPAVLIPRPETEVLVERALKWLRANPARRCIIDVGTGCGCIGISLAIKIQNLDVTASDISAPALDVARGNAHKHGVSDRIQFLQCDLLDRLTIEGSHELSSDLEMRAYDLICANLPYIPSADLASLRVAKFEPRLALDGGPDGLVLIRRLLGQAEERLSPGGALLLEIEERQGQDARAAALAAFPNAQIELFSDLSGRERLLQIQTGS